MALLVCCTLALCPPSALNDRFDHVAWILWLALPPTKSLSPPTLPVRPPARHVGKSPPARSLARCPVARPPPCRRRLALGHSSDPAATANTALLLFPRLVLLKQSPCALLSFENGLCRARDRGEKHATAACLLESAESQQHCCCWNLDAPASYDTRLRVTSGGKARRLKPEELCHDLSPNDTVQQFRGPPSQGELLFARKSAGIRILEVLLNFWTFDGQDGGCYDQVCAFSLSLVLGSGLGLCYGCAA